MSPKMSGMQCKKQFHVILFYALFAYIMKFINPGGISLAAGSGQNNRSTPVKTPRQSRKAPKTHHIIR